MNYIGVFRSIRKKSSWLGAGILLCLWCLFLTGFSVCASEGRQTVTQRVDLSTARELALAQAGLQEETGVSDYGMQKRRAVMGGWSYGDQLKINDKKSGNNEKKVYQALVETDLRSVNEGNKLHISLTPYQFAKKRYVKNSREDLEFQCTWIRAAHAYLMDYNEEFWIGGFYVEYEIPRASNKYCISDLWIYPTEDYSGVKADIAPAEKQLQAAINAIEGGSRYEVVKNIHDYVIDLITYPSGSLGREWYYSITGGLLDKYDHLGVCESYARIFRLICQAKGIPCILVSGGSHRNGAGDVIADHMWNYVQMDDGKWYLVDTTWDDLESGGTDDTYLLVGTAVAGKDHIPVGVFSDAPYQPFSLPPLAYGHYDADVAHTGLKGISFHTSKLSMKCGEAAALQVNTMPGNAACYDLKWTSSDENAAYVTTASGRPVVRAVTAGSAVLTARSASNPSLKATCRITVKHVEKTTVKKATGKAAGSKVTSCAACKKVIRRQTIPKITVKLNYSSLPLQKGKSSGALKISGKSSSDKVKYWKSSNSRVVSVHKTSGKLTAKRTGSATITVVMKSGAQASCRVKVQSGRVRTKSLTVSRTAVTLVRKKSVTIQAVRLPVTSGEKITYTSSNRKVATVTSKGKITAKRKGTARITVRSGSKKVTVKVTVK